MCGACSSQVDAGEEIRCQICNNGFHGIKCANLNKTTIKAINEVNTVSYTCENCLKTGCYAFSGIMNILNKHSDLLNSLIGKVEAVNLGPCQRKEVSTLKPPSSARNTPTPSSASPSTLPAAESAAVPAWQWPARGTTVVTQERQSARQPTATQEGSSARYTGAIPRPNRSNPGQSETAPGSTRVHRNPIIIGTGEGASSIGTQDAFSFRAAPRRQWLYIGRAAPGSKPDDVLAYVRNNLGIEDARCEQLTDTEDICSFKLGVKEDILKTLLVPEKWPPNIAVKEFIPRRRPNMGTFRRRSERQS